MTSHDDSTPGPPDPPGKGGPGDPGSPEDLDARLQAEIEEALGDMSLEDMLDVAEVRAKPGDAAGPSMKTGCIVRIHGDDVFVEFGPKSQGVCQLSQFDKPPTVGEVLPFVVDRFDAKDGLLILSRHGAVAKAAWQTMAVGQVIEAQCTGTNKGGLELEVAKHRAFMPAGQVDIHHVDDLSVFVGQKLKCEIIELDRARGRIVLSRRRCLEAERKLRRGELLETLAEGEERTAVVRSLKDYGAFADLGGVDGLIHISDICHERIKHPSDRLAEGQEVQVKVLRIDRDKDPPRIGLGMKQCQADPFHSQMSKLTEGATVTGRVTRIMPYGAFVEIAPGVEGLVHISQVSNQRVQKISQVIKPNEVVTVKVLDIDPKQRRISLSLRAAKEESESETIRPDDPAMKRLRAKFGGDLKGGIG